MGVMDIYGDGWKVMYGSCLDRLPELADESVDAVVCDPPYELGFMGKSWDSSGIAYDVNVWRECLRVLKPGGHVLAFGGSRTWHRLAVAVEDAGFELRDSIAWLYGSGFPKSLDISKAIDKRGGANISWFGSWFRKWREENGITQKQVASLFPSKTGNLTGCVANWELGFNLPTVDQFNLIKDTFDLPFDSLAEAEREVIGQGTSGKTAIWQDGGMGAFDVTAPATDDARKWSGWGTALKPAFEPVVVGRKPLIGTVSANVLAYGTGGLNIDGTRIGAETVTINTFDNGAKPFGNAVGEPFTSRQSQGRWPSNVMLDEYTAELVDQQSGQIRLTEGAKNLGNFSFAPGQETKKSKMIQGKVTLGGASRFFYVAKANKRDRNEGLDALEDKAVGSLNMRTDAHAERNGETTAPAKNFHPTVKPTDLMRQLIRLVTPPGGVVLDPFTGSGSTGKAAMLEGMQFIGCELTEDYLPIIQGRIDWAVEQVKADRVKSEQDEAKKLF